MRFTTLFKPALRAEGSARVTLAWAANPPLAFHRARKPCQYRPFLQTVLLVFHVCCFLLFIYVLARLVTPLPLSWTCRGLIGLVLLLGAMNRLIFQVVFGNMFSPELPGGLLLVAGVIMGAVLFMAGLALIADIAALATAATRGREAAKRWLGRSRPVILGFSAVLGICAAYNGQKAPQINHVQVALQDLPHELEGTRVVQLSDLHISRLLGKRWLEDVVNRTNALEPDVIVITGDLIDGYVASRDSEMDPLRDLRATHGVFVSMGNHEYYFDYKAWSAKFRALGLQVLVNEHVTLERKGKQLVIAAVTDEAAETFGGEGPSTASAMEGVESAQTTILLRHRPTGILESQQRGVDLQLSGHTHGGMILGVERVVAAANDGLVSGMYQRGGTKIYVSNGTGIWNGFPLRLGRPAEIAEFTLSGP